MTACPKCGSNRIHRSRARSAWERFRRDFSQKRLFRCEACQWRGWGEETGEPQSGMTDDIQEATPPDFTAIDSALEKPTDAAASDERAR